MFWLIVSVSDSVSSRCDADTERSVVWLSG